MNNIFFLKDWVGNFLEELGMLGEGFLRSIFYPICSFIYKMIYYFYNVFELMCNGQIIRSTELAKLFGRVSLLLGVIMLFRVAFAFIQALIDPEAGLTDKEKGIPNVIKKVIIVFVMFGVSGYVFELSRDVQALIVRDNVISRFLLPQQVNNESFGGALAANLFTAFYRVNPDVDPSQFTPSSSSGTKVDPAYCAHDENYINVLRLKISENNDFSYLKNTCLSAKGVYEGTDDDEFVIEFNYIFCIAVGIAVLWFLVNYCISIGVRIVQLTVLQILSPVAFIGYLEPKSDNAFSRWLKLYISTYLDLFIRMGIISFVCYLCALIMEGWNSGNGVFWTSVGNPQGFVRIVIGIFMILALFQFAKKAPDLLKEVLPKSGANGSALGFGTSDTGKTLSGFGSAALGGAIGGAMGAMTHYRTQRNAGKGRLRSAFSGAGGLLTGSAKTGYAGAKGGMKSLPENLSKQRASNNKYNDLYMNGGNLTTAATEFLGDAFGESRGQKDARLLSNYEMANDTLSDVKEMAHESKSWRDANKKYENLIHSGTASPEDIAKQRIILDRTEEAVITAAMNGYTYAPDRGDDRSENAALNINSRVTRYNSVTKARKVEGISEEVFSYEELSNQVGVANRKIAEIVGDEGYERRKASGEFVGNDMGKSTKKN